MNIKEFDSGEKLKIGFNNSGACLKNFIRNVSRPDGGGPVRITGYQKRWIL